MSTISSDTQDSKQNRTNASKSTIGPDDQIQGFHYSALHAVTGYDYLTRKWLPREGPVFYAFIKVLRGHCFYNPDTGEMRTNCFPELATIAKECGVSRSTICRLIKRDTAGRFVNKSLERFIVIEKRWRKMKHQDDQERTVQTSNLYYVALDDPPIPEDDALVAEKEAELLAIAALRSTECQNDTQGGVSNWHSKSRVKMTQRNRNTGNNLDNTDFHRSAHEDESGGEAIRKAGGSAKPGTKPEKTKRDGVRIENRSEEEVAREQAIEQADAAAGGVVYDNLVQLGDQNAGLGTKKLIEAMVEAGAPLDRLIDLADLGRRRVRRFRLRGGHVDNDAGFYMSTMRNLITEARRKYWDLEKIERQDRKNHERAINSAEKRRR